MSVENDKSVKQAYNQRYYAERSKDPEFRKANSVRAKLWHEKKSQDSEYKRRRAAKVQEWRKRNPAKVAAVAKRRVKSGANQVRRHNISLAEFRRKKAEQKDCCAICSERKKLCIDHNHETKKVRDLLCNFCNRTTGLVEKKGDLILAIQAYLQRHKE